jgi:dephospho-CoA kinase
MERKPRQPFLRKDSVNRAPKPLLSPNNGKIIGVTGGIATGKSFVLECFRELGFEVFSSDNVVHELLKKGGKAFDQVSKLCPKAVAESGIDRNILGQEVFSDPHKLALLESIIHPMVREAQMEFLIKTKNLQGKSAVFEVPLLFESKREKFYDFIVVTTAPHHIQKSRALARPNMSEEKFESIVKKQLPDHVKTKKAHFIVATGKTPELTFKAIRSLVHGNQDKRNNFRHRDDRPVRKRRGSDN